MSYKSENNHSSCPIQAIPRAIFIGIDDLQNLFSPTETIQIQKQLVKQFADLDRRRLLAQKTSEITKLSLGISNMCISRLGAVEIQPRELLVDGLRKELRQKLKKVLALWEENILRTLSKQSIQLKAFRKAFLFVSEHIGVNGVAMLVLLLAVYCKKGFFVGGKRKYSLLLAQPFILRGQKLTTKLVFDYIWNKSYQNFILVVTGCIKKNLAFFGLQSSLYIVTLVQRRF